MSDIETEERDGFTLGDLPFLAGITLLSLSFAAIVVLLIILFDVYIDNTPVNFGNYAISKTAGIFFK